MGAQFLREQALLRSAAPALGLCDPAVGPLRIHGTVEPAGIYRGLARISPGVPQRRKRDAPAFALGSRLGAIDEDAENPGLQRRPALEPVNPLQNSDPGFLRRIFGSRPAIHKGLSQAYQAPVIALDNLQKGCLVAFPQPLYQRCVFSRVTQTAGGVMCPVLGGRGRQACGWPSSRNLPPLCQPGSSLLPRSTFICVVFER